MFGLNITKPSSKPNGLKILIVGCGKVGTTLARELSKEGHDITVVDKNAEKVHMNVNTYDVMGVVGNGASYSTLVEGGVETADLIIAVTRSDELNILCCTLAKQGRDIATIARVRDPDYNKEVKYLKQSLGLNMVINPEKETAAEMARVLYLPTALEINSFAHGHAEHTRVKLPEGNLLCGMTPAELGAQLREKAKKVSILITMVERGGEVFIPAGDFVFEANDIVSFVGNRNVTRLFLDYIGFKTNRAHNALIVGGGEIAFYLAEQLISMGIDVKIIEHDSKRCEELSIALPKAVIINDDGTEQEVLAAAGIEDAEAFVAVTGMDEENILLTLYARRVSKAKTITKINRSSFKEVMNDLDLGSLFYPAYITTEMILAFVRAKSNSRTVGEGVTTLAQFCDGAVEAIEFCVDEESEVTGTMLMNLNLKKNVLVSFIYRNGNVIIPSGQDTIEVGDTAMVVTTNKGFSNICDILA